MGFFGEFIINLQHIFTIVYKFTFIYWDYSEFIDYHPTEHVIHWEFFFSYSMFKWDCTLSMGTLPKNGIPCFQNLQYHPLEIAMEIKDCTETLACV